ncbi:NIPSNAP family protein [Paenibacillus qinlingensis]|uniref:NIPSNAP domain-containing protein n=1 Tax=Paenibacillus qinlingensis TaxID=1837343 RepID=A0ABU1NS19_9BACL|nr:NIPSNAP family protein [Paenibacillus qinlingensis]MDR6550244.1 hypothetical protein [Paenibacillus qinlingensis]
MLYELRIYDIVPGRMEAILDRFRDNVIALLAKHEMKTTNFWVDADESKNRLYYVLEHENADSRERNFEAFLHDPEWLDIQYRTELNGPLYEKIESIFMQNVPFFKSI